MLHSIIGENSKSDSKTTNTKTSDSKPNHDLKGKRKDLSFAMRNMIENEQQNVMEMYRELKKKQRGENKE